MFFFESAKSLMRIKGEGGFTDPEWYMVKKIVQKLKQELNNEDGGGNM